MKEALLQLSSSFAALAGLHNAQERRVMEDSGQLINIGGVCSVALADEVAAEVGYGALLSFGAGVRLHELHDHAGNSQAILLALSCARGVLAGALGVIDIMVD